MKMGIKSKILTSTAVVVFCCLLLCDTFAYLYFSNIFKTQVVNDNRTKLEQTVYQIQSMCNDIQNLAQYMAVNQEIQSFIRYNGVPGRADKILGTERAIQAVRNFVNMRDYVHSVFIVTADGDVFSNVRANESDYQQAIKEDWYKSFKSGGRMSGYTRPHYLVKEQEKPAKVISYIIRFFELKNPRNIDELVINIRMEYFGKAIGLAVRDFDGFIWMNGQNEAYYSSGERYDALSWDDGISVFKMDSMEFPEIDGENPQYVELFKELPNEWIFVAVISEAKMLQKVRNILNFFLLFGLVSLSVIVIVIMPVILNITRPLSTLTTAIREVAEGKIDSEIDIKSGDELQVLGEGFNRMLKELKRYLSDSIQYEKTKRKMQVDLLLSQINPHFIYNTLNVIIYLSEEGRNSEAVIAIKNFIKILQDAVRIGDEEIFGRIQEEIEVVNLYMKIMEYRYPERFTMVWKVEEGLLNCLIPRTILQPIIENSLFHGILPGDEMGKIVVGIAQEGRNIKIEVTDNGIGMEKSFIDEILSGHKPVERGARMRSIGLSNIIERIRFIYGPEYCLSIESIPGVSTRVMILIPLEN